MDDDSTDRIIHMASLRPVEQNAWFSRLQKNREGAPLPTVANAMMILDNDPKLDGMLAYDAFRLEHLLLRAAPPAEDGGASMPGPYPRPWGAEDVALTQGYMQRVWSPKFPRGAIEDAMLASAAVKRFHPVADWLAEIRWDGKARIDFWLTNAFDAENNAYHRAVGAKFLVAAVRRVRQPGCKFDHMLVLEGAQGIGKSRACEAMFGAEWFSDAVPPDLNNKDAAMALHGKWCLEFAEIEHLIRAEVETIKAFLSRRTDRYRPPYGKAYVERPRQGVLIGTTNADDYLRDSTGNRRIWPVRCKTASPDWLIVNRDQLWAEAAYRESRGETIWLDDEEALCRATSAQAERLSEDLWESAVAEWVIGRSEVRVHQILTDALLVPKERLNKAQEMRVGALLRRRGWTKATRRREGEPTKVWFPPGQVPPPDPEETGQSDLLGNRW